MIVTSCGSKKVKRYEATWESLTQHAVPDWLLDTKFGIYAHWIEASGAKYAGLAVVHHDEGLSKILNIQLIL